jgi:hypothetical protein
MGFLNASKPSRRSIMQKLQVGFVTFVLSFFTCQSMWAAIVDVDVTIKSVDVKSREITVSYETDLGDKVIELDVSRKAKITVNDKESTLDNVIPGQKAKVSYEKELQIITKIDAKGTGTAVGPEVCRFFLSISEFGDCVLKVEQTKSPISSATKFEGESMKLEHLPNTEILKASDGRYRITHSFEKLDQLSRVFLTVVNTVELDKHAGTVSFTPLKKDVAEADYQRTVQFPAVICYDRLPMQIDSGLDLQVILEEPFSRLGVNLGRGNDGKTFTGVYWIEKKDGKKEIPTQILNAMPFDLKEGTERKFRLPLPNARIEENCLIRLVARGNDGNKSELRHFMIQGQQHPLLRMGVAEKKELTYVTFLYPGGYADKAGVKVGDVIESINDQQVKSMSDAIKLLHKVPLGDKSQIKIHRGDEQKEIFFDFK